MTVKALLERLKHLVKRGAMLCGANRLLVRILRSPIVLGYHRVVEASESLLVDRIGFVSPLEFSAHLDYFEAIGCSFRPLGEVLRSDSSASVAITFDDGYRDLRTSALPLLSKRGAPFSVFLIGSLSGRSTLLWQHELYALLDALPVHARHGALIDAMSAAIPRVEVERVTALGGDLVGALIRRLQPAEILAVVDVLRLRWEGNGNWSDLYLSESELDDLSANGASFEAHGYDHWALTCLTPQALDAELENGRDAIGRRFGTRPSVLALAHGLGGDRELEAARRAGFEHVVIGSHALFSGGGYEVPRIWPRGSSVEVSWMLSKALLAAAWHELRLLFRRGPAWTA